MKILKRSFLALAAVALMTACSEEKLAGDNPDNNRPDIEEGEGVFMSLQIKMPTGGSRSQTTDNGGSTDGTEIGSDAENYVSNVLIVLTDPQNNVITAGTVLANNLTAMTADTYKSVAKFQKTQIASYYNGDTPLTDPKVNVYVFCNPTQDLVTAVNAAANSDAATTSNWVNTVCTVVVTAGNSNTGIWSPNSFLMSNAQVAVRKLPLHLSDWNSYKTADTAFHLSEINAAGTDHEVNNGTGDDNLNGGPVKVERAVARFDFKDGSGNTESPNTYGVLYGNKYDEAGNLVPGEQGPLFINVELQRICLTNMSKQFYYLPSVSADGTPTDATLCGPETPKNYVVSPNYETFKQETAKGIAAATFNYPFYNADNEIDNLSADSGNDQWSSYYISDVLNGTTDNTPSVTTNYQGPYHVWRYCTENAIPADPERQTYGRTTIVVFKGKITPSQAAIDLIIEPETDEDEATIKDNETKYPGMAEVAKALTNATGDPSKDPILYAHAGTLYASWDMVKKAVEAEAVTITANGDVEINRSSTLYMACYGTGGMGSFEYEYTHQEVGEDGTETSVTDKLTYNDELAPDANSSNAAWNAWRAAVSAETPNQTTINETLTAMRKAMTENENPDLNFTLYQSSIDNRYGAGYYCYYYYRNRHNDNLDNGVMGPMEFAVVRNNVYKLAVTNIKKLGHPRLSTNDPDSPTPDTPDESDNVYIDVQCQVLPWVVRINNIEF